jgi:hypothetical protein
VPLHELHHMWFMHDEASPHFLRIVRQDLNQTFGEQWIERRVPVNWPARSPDLNPLDFWPWGHLKALVYSMPISDLEMLEQRVENASGNSNETREFRQSEHICVTKLF